VLARDRKRLLVALPDLLRPNALLEPVVAGQEQVVDLRARFRLVHGANRSRSDEALQCSSQMLAVFSVIHVLLSAALIGLVLMHSGRDAGLGGMGFTPASQGGTHIVERNLTRLTIVVAILFFANTVVLFRLLQ
jgi:preprotein translocase subunit SecG